MLHCGTQFRNLLRNLAMTHKNPPKQPSKTYVIISVTIAFVVLMAWAIWFFSYIGAK